MSKIVSERPSVAEIEETVHEIISATQPTVSTVEDLFVEEFVGSNIEQPSPIHRKSTSESSVDSVNSQGEERPFNTYTSQLAVENLLAELFAQGEEALAKQLAEFYLASRASPETPCQFQFSPLTTPLVVQANTINQPIIMAIVPPPLTKMQRILAA